MPTEQDQAVRDVSTAAASVQAEESEHDGQEVQIVDRRPEALAQRQMQEVADSSPQVQAAAQQSTAVSDDSSGESSSPVVETMDDWDEELISRPRSGAVTSIDPEHEEELAANAGLVRMAGNADKIINMAAAWSNLLSGGPFSTVDTGVATTGVVGAATGVAGMITDQAQGTSATNRENQAQSGDSTDFIEGAASDIVSGIGSAISGAVSAVKAIVTIYKVKDGAAGKEELATAARDLTSALKSGFEAGMSIQKFVSGTVTPGIVAALPGIGLAISAADLLINAYNAHQASGNEEEMQTVSQEYKTDLTSLMGQAPENNKDLFKDEKRGKFFSRETYLRVPSVVMAELNDANNESDAAVKRTKQNAFKVKYKIQSAISFNALYFAIKAYELGSKMQEINQKRRVHGGRKIATALINIAGDIATFFPADGGITAGVLKGTAAGLDAAQAGGKFIQKISRDYGILGGDETRSTDAKKVEYANHTKTIYQLLTNVPKPVMGAQLPQLKKIENIIKATGASTTIVYQTDYSSEDSISRQVMLIMNSMNKGR